MMRRKSRNVGAMRLISWAVAGRLYAVLLGILVCLNWALPGGMRVLYEGIKNVGVLFRLLVFCSSQDCFNEWCKTYLVITVEETK